ncbi:MAG: hypothetical protein QN173_00515 [Armatimonadota bacterium]|nr:hypothetical protein [Armatimonadota bacterium]MDR7400646.1 hypothetical protein [Armatimonadota bacterium]MDR7403174.1 hypothetical protein [Armatimonadota bacterium]MDR7436543.1 hypothetical protein [Armatimonadota bacterium]MDR7472578.1 hypothetical protein [Armatimonadota bacterium]
MDGWLAGAAGTLLAAAAATAAWRGWERFRAEVRSALDQTPDIACRRQTHRGMICSVWGYELEVDLQVAYLDACLRRLPAARVADALARALRRRIPPVAPPPWALVAGRLFPLLRRQDRLPPSDDYPPETRLARRSVDAEVAVIYVIEGYHQVTYVTEGMVRAWGMGLDGLHARACDNLRERTRHILREIGGPRTDYVALDGYDAARLLVGDLLVPAGMDDPLLAVPHEHACLLAPARQRDALAAQAAALFARAAAPLTRRLYRLGPAGPLPQA